MMHDGLPSTSSVIDNHHSFGSFSSGSHRSTTLQQLADMSRPPTVKLAVRGDALLDHPRWNKGTAFTQDERKEFNLTSRLPSSICSLDLQLSRAYKQYQDQDSDMKKVCRAISTLAKE